MVKKNELKKELKNDNKVSDLKNKKTVNLEGKKVIDNSSTKKIKIKVIGIGGGGSNIVFELSKKLKECSSQKIDFVVANTDTQALSSISKNLKTFPFGNKTTKGLGCGSDVGLAEKAAQEDVERIKKLFSDEKDLYILVSSLGGGTGTGATPVFAKIANEYKVPVLGIFTLPFIFEGKKKTDASLSAIEKMKESTNAYMVLPNEKIFSLSKEEVSFSQALNLLNDHLANCLEGLFKTIYNSGLINIDWADIKTVLEGNKKLAYIDVVNIKYSQNLEEFAKNILKNPILNYNFENANNLIFNIESSRNLSLQLLFEISERISVHVPNARIIFGLMDNPKLKNDIKITIFSTTLDIKVSGKDSVQVMRAKPVIKDGELSLVAKEPKKKKELVVIKEKDETEKRDIVEDNIEDLLKGDDLTVFEEKNVSTIVEPVFENVQKNVNVEERVIRRNALETKELERLEREQQDNEEKIFDIPAFMRKEKDKNKKK